MDISTFILLGCFTILIWKLLTAKTANLKKLPAGPKGLPILGNLLSLRNDPWKFLAEATEKYGPVFTVSMGNQCVVVLNRFDIMKEAMKMNVFQGRMRNGAMVKLSQNLGIIAADGQLWQENRRFVLHSLRDLGMGRLKMQEIVTDEVNKFVDYLKTCNGKPTDFSSALEMATCNVICSLAFGKEDRCDNCKLHKAFIDIRENIKLSLKMEFLSLLKPWTNLIVSYFVGKMIRNRTLVVNYFKELIQEKKQSPDSEGIIKLYLEEAKKYENDPEGRGKYFYDDELAEVCLDLFVAGTETSSTTIKWAILYMAEHPDIQKKVQDELDEVIGRSRYPTLNDKSNLPYSQAVLQEIERFGSIANFGILHATQDDVVFHGWEFPKQTAVMLYLYGIHRSKELWGDPEIFRPSRFLNEDGQVFRPEYLIPFGIGKRICPGESLAKAEIFLFFTTLLHCFKFVSVDGQPTSKSRIAPRIIRSPPSYKIIARDRLF